MTRAGTIELRYAPVDRGFGMTSVPAKVSPSGRLELPREIRKAAGLDRGGNVVVELHGREIRVRRVEDVVAQAQEFSRKLLRDHPEASVDHFLAERRREAAKE
jgi:bifunctional DNA-binding transcriptional regulator/antitoxin component of YhaV-PrlF toxin-antitoxin module